MTYDELLIESDVEGLTVKEKHLRANKGRIKGNKIAIKKDTTDIEKTCILAEELGHYYTTTGNILDLKNVCNRKQELRAMKYAYEILVPIKSLIKASYNGCTNLYELSEYLDVTEEFLKDALKHYKSVYGLFVEVDNYCIYFNPLTVCKYNYKF